MTHRLHITRVEGRDAFVSTLFREGHEPITTVAQPGPSGWQLMPAGITDVSYWASEKCEVTAAWPLTNSHTRRTRLPQRIVRALDDCPGGWTPREPD